MYRYFHIFSYVISSHDYPKRIYGWVNGRGARKCFDRFRPLFETASVAEVHQMPFFRENCTTKFHLPSYLTCWCRRTGDSFVNPRQQPGPEHQQLRTRMQEQRECTYSACASERVAHPKPCHVPTWPIYDERGGGKRTCVIKGWSDRGIWRRQARARARIFMLLPIVVIRVQCRQHRRRHLSSTFLIKIL